MDSEFWNKRYVENDFPWDAGSITTPLKEYFDQLEDKSLKILIPGAGNSYEAVYLFENGFKNVFVCDWAEKALANIKSRSPNFPEEQLLCVDFFQLEESGFDRMIEQTFFCAIDPSLRADYVQKAHSILKPGGKIVGLLFEREREGGPPFCGHRKDYLPLFEKHFSKVMMEDCFNSIPPRMGNELFINVEK